MIVFYCTFLIWGRRVTIENIGSSIPSFIKLNSSRIRKLAAIVRKYNWKKLLKNFQTQF